MLVVINVFLVRGLGLLLHRDHSLKHPPKNILVIKMLGLGSVLMAADSLYSLRKRYPNARIILLCGKGVAAGVEPLKLFDEVWVNDDRNVLTMVTSGFQSLWKAIRLKHLWVLDLEVYSVLTTLFSAWTMARNRFGFQLNKVHFRNYLNTHNCYFNQFITVYENYENLVKAMGVEQIEAFQLSVSPASRIFETPCIAINNTCSELGGNLRKIPDNLMRQMVEYLLEQSSYTLVFTGAPADHSANDAWIETNGFNQESRVKNIAGKLSFAAYYAFLQQECKAMISIDSAPFHMAIKAGIPTLSLWGPIRPVQRFRFEEHPIHRYLSLDMHCSPCIHLSDVVPCGGDNRCMKDMQWQDIRMELDLLIQRLKG